MFRILQVIIYNIPPLNHRRLSQMAQKKMLDRLSIYIPDSKKGQQPVQRLIKLGDKRDRSVNYLVVEAILAYLKQEERK
jgi:hypothetical protein